MAVIVVLCFVATEDRGVIFSLLAVIFRQAPVTVLRQRRKLRTAKEGGNIYIF